MTKIKAQLFQSQFGNQVFSKLVHSPCKDCLYSHSFDYVGTGTSTLIRSSRRFSAFDTASRNSSTSFRGSRAGRSGHYNVVEKIVWLRYSSFVDLNIDFWHNMKSGRIAKTSLQSYTSPGICFAKCWHDEVDLQCSFV